MTAALVDYARAQFEMSAPGADGTPRLSHIEAAARAGNEAARAELDALPTLPAAGDYLWGWFLELSAARGNSGFGASPISHQEIEAWSRLTGRRVAAWEVGAIRAIDQAFMEVQAGAHDQRAKQRQRAA